jgi:ubiquinone/menaquinone biosynthesis C-methylase UbiE
MHIDTQRIASIASHYAALDPLEAYYLGKSQIRLDSRPMLPEAQDVLAQTLHGAGKVLDVGCGDGHTLIANANSFTNGFGVDDSDFIIERATASACNAGVTNVKFQRAKAISLPFPDSHFDLVFSERGPLGHADSTLEEVLRVLKEGGLVFIETGGSHNMIELPRPDGLTHEGTLLTSLEIERDRFERFGLDITLLASTKRKLFFATLYNWFEYQCSVLRYMEVPTPWESSADYLLMVMNRASCSSGGVAITYHMVWMAGYKTSVSDATLNKAET